MKTLFLVLAFVALFKAQTPTTSCTSVSCPTGQSCLDGGCYQFCQANGGVSNCAAGYICQATSALSSSICVLDPCRSCPQNSVCDASTGNRCVSDLCANSQCAAPTRCDPATGRCVCTLDGGCPAGNNCVITTGSTTGYCAVDPCASVTCTSPQTCVEGRCVSPTTQCSSSSPCPTGLVCSAGTCSRCSPNIPCPSGSVCSSTGLCVADPCEGRCTNTQVCLRDASGTSVTGTCTELCSATTPCPSGKMCVGDLCVADPCATVRCEAGFTCVNGQCSPQRCDAAQASCPSGTSCVDGVCRNLCSGVLCSANSQCDPNLGRCVAIACTADAMMCPGGEYVSRDPSRNCEFAPCPTSTCSPNTCPAPSTCNTDGRCVCGTTTCPSGTVCTAHESTGSLRSVSCDSLVCTQVVQTCPDGTVIRPDENCQLPSCPSLCNVPCPTGTTCRLGTCVKPCGNTVCLATEECTLEGRCVAPSTCPAGCPIGTTCTNGRCLCNGVLCGSSQICYPDIRSTSLTPVYACRDACLNNPCANNADGLTTCVPSATSATGYICACSFDATTTNTGSLSGAALVCSGCNGNTCPPPDPCSRCLTASGERAECTVDSTGAVLCNPCGSCPTGSKCEVANGVPRCSTSSPCEPNPCTRTTTTNDGLFAREMGICRVNADGAAQCFYGTGCSSLNCPNGCVETAVAGSLVPVGQCLPEDVCANVVCQRPGSVCVADRTTTTGFACVDPCDPNPCFGYPCSSLRDSTGMVRPSCSIPVDVDPCVNARCPTGQLCRPNPSGATNYTCVGVTDPCANSPCGTDSNVICVAAAAGTLSTVGGYACVRPCSATTCLEGQVCQTGANGAECVEPTVCPSAAASCRLYCGGEAPILTDNCRCGCPAPVGNPAVLVTTTYTFEGSIDAALLNRIGALLNSAVSGQVIVTISSSNGQTTITVQTVSNDSTETGVTPAQIAAAVESATASSSGSSDSGSIPDSGAFLSVF